jgi:PAS domain S-box-containing protein
VNEATELNRWFDVSAYRVGGDESRKVAILFNDITESRTAVARLKLLSAALEAASNGIALTDAQGTLQWVNPAFAELTGYSSDEALGQTSRLLKSGRQPLEFYRAMWETITRGEAWRGELTNKRKDGTLYDDEMTITPVRAAGGAITHYVAINQDITSRKRWEEELACFNSVAVGRELRMVELKQEINALCAAAGRPPQYDLDFAEESYETKT